MLSLPLDLVVGRSRTGHTASVKTVSDSGKDIGALCSTHIGIVQRVDRQTGDEAREVLIVRILRGTSSAIDDDGAMLADSLHL